ncbi:MAG: guanine deaminase [Planctomycetota bacterium]
MARAYRGTILHSLTPRHVVFLPQGWLVVEADRIAGVYSDSEFSASQRRACEVVDRDGCLILPGLVDAHLHIPQIDVIGIESENLIDWLQDHIFEEEMANSEPEIARDRAQRTFDGLLRSGTTSCAAFSSSHTLATDIAFEEASRAGIRAIIGKVLMNREAPAALLQEARPALDETADLIKKWSGHDDGRLDVAITPRFGISCTDDLLQGAGELAHSSGCPVQTHLSENKGELAAIAELFPQRRDYTDVYDHAGLLRPRCILAHCIHLSDDELQRMSNAEAAAVYCPDSNFFLHSGRFPLQRALDNDVTVALGSDVGAGTSFSLFEAMKMGNYMQTEQVDPNLLLYLATLGGAYALGWGDRIGNFATGKEADFIVLDPEQVLRGMEIVEENQRKLLSILIHRGHAATVREVYVRGSRLFG